MPRPITPLNDRFWPKVDIVEGGCWEWTGSKRQGGYGAFRDGDKIKRAHRVSWELVYGPIPDGKVVCHTCDNPGCVHTEHLWLGTKALNELDKKLKGRAKGRTKLGK